MPGYGYRSGVLGTFAGEADRDASSGSVTAQQQRKRPRPERGEKKAKKEKKRKRNREEQPGEQPAGVELIDDGGSTPPPASDAAKPPATGLAAAPPAGSLAAQDPSGPRGAWRKELEGEEAMDDGLDEVETDEMVEKKLAESRARREALIAKWVNRGEDGGGGFAMPDTNLSQEKDAESDGEEVAAFFAKQKELSESKPEDAKALEDKKAVNRFILEQRRNEDGDMFGEEEDVQEALNRSSDQVAQAISQTGASGSDWNDAEGYYKATVGEVMAGRYHVVENACGKGVFSNVIKAKDQQDNIMVAIKIMRCNDMMRKAAEKEVEVLERLAAADKGNKRNVIRMLRHFIYRDHMCVVFECMWDNLRVALKRYTKDKGMSLKAVRAYTRQLLIGLQHIHRCQLVHADIKPDNILITAGHNLVKICDLGSAVEFTEVEATPYLVSRFYRSPEICLGNKYGPPADVWALGASLCELFTGRILFPGRSNNDMLRLYMDLKGKIPRKFITGGLTHKQHWDDNLDFKHLTYCKVTRKKVTRIITDCAAKRSVFDLVMARVGPEKQKSEDREDQLYVKKAKQFADLITQMTIYDPEKRPAPESLLQHPFVSDAGFGSKPKGEKK